MMEEGKEKNEVFENNDQDKIFSKAIRAGKRTYFFDVKVTKGNDYYVTVTESKKRYQNDGRYFYEKHKLFLFKEDFDKFLEGLEESINFVQQNGLNSSVVKTHEDEPAQNYANIDFDDLEKVDVSFHEEEKE